MLVEKPGGEDGLSRAYLYARHASKAFNRRMHKILQDLCRELAGELSGNLYAVLLGGNYGRGEGGTRSSTGGHGTGIWSIGEAPAEDIDLLIVSWFDIRGRREAISGIIRKYEDIFTVPIDLAPVVTPVRLMFIPHRFNWRRLISNSKLLYGPPRLAHTLSRRYGDSFARDRRLAWSLLFDQGLRLIEVIAHEQGVLRRRRGGSIAAHQGKLFREIALAITLSVGRYEDSVDLQLHEFIVLMDELEDSRGNFDHLRLLKSLLPKAVSLLREPEQPALDMPENWLYHLNLWLEADHFLSENLPLCPEPLLRMRLARCRKTISAIAGNQGIIPPRQYRSVKRLTALLQWVREHVFLI
jgi:hypothetical protein